ncbi:GntP family permease [Tautonia plasticadhaerens]|uniref:Low-affinity gluconate transporter n=1 Tax=Tautonia plasticadhaerens TaxID=2527974 RepID=A0A518HDM7_9BACT|nr:SLC13 family permease [Tautonia plasticadhaerens]QDV38962.1 Low-affinity gluconate transporter [Tautonia plasticadhaerens]
MEIHPLIILAVGIATVIGMILVLRLNAFIALITSAMLVSLMSPGPVASKIARVAEEFGKTAGGIGIVIALAAVIGACLMESGAADRIVRAFLRVLGEKRASTALMGSGFVLAIPVFFDTVFYLLVPLGRSLYRRTGTHYLKYVLAIGCGGAITHTLVPPTPGPLLMADLLGIDKGMMILVGTAVALPAAIAGLAFCGWADRRMPTPMRPISGMEEPTPPPDDALPPLGLSALPVLLPVLLISINTALSTYADAERAALVTASQVRDPAAIAAALDADAPEGSPASRLAPLVPELRLAESDPEAVAELLNARVLAPRGPGAALAEGDLSRKSEAQVEHLNRLVLEGLVPESALERHDWETARRRASDFASIVGDTNFALLLAAAVSLMLVVRQRGTGLEDLAKLVEHALMSAGVIILITSAGGAFGAMLREAGIGDVIQGAFGDDGSGGGASTGLVLMLVGFGVSAVLKVAQGSSTVAMITATGIMAALLPPGGSSALGYNMAYLATAIGSGSLIGSWMNDSGFWVFAKMSGLTEAEALKSWTPLLLVLGTVGLVVSLLLALALPLTSLG